MQGPLESRPPATGHVAVGTTPTLIRGYNPRRTGLALTNIGTETAYFSFGGIHDTGDGYGIPANGFIAFSAPDMVYAICATGAAILSYFEES